MSLQKAVAHLLQFDNSDQASSLIVPNKIRVQNL